MFATATALAAMRWAQDRYLFILGAVAFTAATVGYLHRRCHRPGDTGHIAGMGIAYTAMLTAFYVDNGPHLPLWDRLPTPAFWLLPSAIAAPLITRAIIRARNGPPRPDPEVPPTARSSWSRPGAARDARHPVAEVDDGRVEAGGIAGRDRVGDGPVHGGPATELLAGQVADRDHQVVVLLDFADMGGAAAGATAGGGAGRRRSRRDRSPARVACRPRPPGCCWHGATARRPGATAPS